MTWQSVALDALHVVLVLGLAWVAAWQQRAAMLVRRLNGSTEALHRELVRSRGPADERTEDEPT